MVNLIRLRLFFSHSAPARTSFSPSSGIDDIANGNLLTLTDTEAGSATVDVDDGATPLVRPRRDRWRLEFYNYGTCTRHT